MKLYSINGWATHFEMRDTKRIDGPMKWIPIPTKTDGLGFARMRQDKRAVDLLAAWHLMLGVAAKQPRAHRGRLVRDGQPLTACDLALMTGFPARIFEHALEFFSQPSPGWLLAEEFATDAATCGENGLQDRTGQEKTGQKAAPQPAPAPVASLPFASPEFAAAWSDFEQHRRELRKKLTPRAAALQLKKLEAMGEPRAIAAIRHSVGNGWQGIFEPHSIGSGPNRGGATLEKRFDKF